MYLRRKQLHARVVSEAGAQRRGERHRGTRHLELLVDKVLGGFPT